MLTTPHLDGFAKQSVRFTDFYVSPTCAPTRSALLTGRHEFKNGVTHTIDERERLTPKAGGDQAPAQASSRRGCHQGAGGVFHPEAVAVLNWRHRAGEPP